MILNRWSNLLPRVVLNRGEAIDGRKKEVEDDNLNSSRLWLLSKFMVDKGLTPLITTPSLRDGSNTISGGRFYTFPYIHQNTNI